MEIEAVLAKTPVEKKAETAERWRYFDYQLKVLRSATLRAGRSLFQVDDVLLKYYSDSVPHPEVNSAEAEGEVVGIDTEMEMGSESDQEKPQDSPVYSTEAKGETVGMGMGSGIVEEPLRIALRLYVNASK